MNDEELRARERNSKIFKKLQSLFKEDDVFWNNEIQANLFVSLILLVLALVLVLSCFLAFIGIFDVPMERMLVMVFINVPLLIGGNIISAIYRGQKHWIKYVLCMISISASVGLCGVVSIFVPIIICIPVVISCRYYSRRFTNTVSILTVFGMAVSELLYSKYGMLDLNLVSVPKGTILEVGDTGLRDVVEVADYSQITYLINLYRGSFMPRLLLFIIVALICAELSRRAHEMVIDQEAITKKIAGERAELKMATDIQSAFLPKTFPPFENHPELDIYAIMKPAREVGGDFYDYYFLDEDHLLMLVADVSGKGIPAALFMMISKVILKTHASFNNSPAAIARSVNEQLCENNKIDMFVTAWIGVLELSTGIVTAVDAGHEYPVVKHMDGNYEIVKGKKSFVLAGMEGVNYKEYTFKFGKGDRLFLYTDGVVEATNSDEKMYGIERLVKCLNSNQVASSKELLEKIQKDIDAFVRNAPQFDDLTMVSLNYKVD